MTATVRLLPDPVDPHRTLALVTSASEARAMTDYAHEPLADVDPDQLTPADEPAPAWTHKPGIADDRGYAETDGRRWAIALGMAGVRRRNAVHRARLTADELATAAARFGLVPDPASLPLSAVRRPTSGPGPDISETVRAAFRAEAADRHRELGDVSMAAWRAMPNEPGAFLTRGESSDLTANHHDYVERRLNSAARNTGAPAHFRLARLAVD